MAWVPVHQNLMRHPKLIRTAVQLGIKRVHCVGHLVSLWCWAMDYAPKGNITDFLAEEVALGSEWEGSAELWVATLYREGWVDEDGYLHDWDEYGGALIEKRKADAKRKRADRKKDSIGRPATSDVASVGRPTDIRVTAPVEYSRVEESRGEGEDAHTHVASQEGKAE